MSARVALGAVSLLLAAFIPLQAAADPIDPTQPVAAVAFRTGSDVLVTWVSGSETPDSFRIYGIRDEIATLLSTEEGEATSAEVEDGFPKYAVTAVQGGTESEPALASASLRLICVRVEPGIPPGVGIDHSCTAAVEPRIATTGSFDLMLR